METERENYFPVFMKKREILNNIQKEEIKSLLNNTNNNYKKNERIKKLINLISNKKENSYSSFIKKEKNKYKMLISNLEHNKKIDLIEFKIKSVLDLIENFKKKYINNQHDKYSKIKNFIENFNDQNPKVNLSNRKLELNNNLSYRSISLENNKINTHNKNDSKSKTITVIEKRNKIFKDLSNKYNSKHFSKKNLVVNGNNNLSITKKNVIQKHQKSNSQILKTGKKSDFHLYKKKLNKNIELFTNRKKYNNINCLNDKSSKNLNKKFLSQSQFYNNNNNKNFFINNNYILKNFNNSKKSVKHANLDKKNFKPSHKKNIMKNNIKYINNSTIQNENLSSTREASEKIMNINKINCKIINKKIRTNQVRIRNINKLSELSPSFFKFICKSDRTESAKKINHRYKFDY